MNITQETPSARGACCLFFKVSPEQGIKFYTTEDERDEAFRLQENAASVCLGPKVYNKLEMPWLESWELPWSRSEKPEIAYGYVTEVVDTRKISVQEFEILYSWLEEYGIGTGDIAEYHNVGKTKDGMVVRYDFDPAHYEQYRDELLEAWERDEWKKLLDL